MFLKFLLGAIVAISLNLSVVPAQSKPHPQPHQASQTSTNKAAINSEAHSESFWVKTVDDPVAFFTFVLSIFTAVLAGVSITQIIFLIRADRTASITAGAAKDSADAAVAQAKISERALTQLERPYVFVFGAGNVRSDEDTGEFFIEYTVANYGKMPAIIEGAWIDFVLGVAGVPQTPTLLENDHSLLVAPIIQAGEKRLLRAYLPENMIDKEGASFVVIKGTDDLLQIPELAIPKDHDVFFRAIVSYRSPTSLGHETGALWLFMGGQLVQRGGEEYNYVK